MSGGGFFYFLSRVWCALFHRKHHKMNTLLFGDERLYSARICTKCADLKGGGT